MVSAQLMALMLTGASAGAPPAVRRIVVSTLKDRGGKQSVVRMLTEKLVTDVSRLAVGWQVLSRSDLPNLLGVMAQQAKFGQADAETLGRVGKALKADELVTGTIDRVGATCLLTLQRFDVHTLAILDQRSQTLRNPTTTDLLQAIDEVADRLFPDEALRLGASAGGGPCSTFCLDLEVLRPGGSLCPGERTGANLLSDRAGYVVIFDVFGADDAMVIFPNPSNPTGRVEAGQKLSLFPGGLVAVPFPGGAAERLVAFRADRPELLDHAGGAWPGPCRVSASRARALHRRPRRALGHDLTETEDGYTFLSSGDPACQSIAPPPPVGASLAQVPACQ